jgi:hypothetical protein
MIRFLLLTRDRWAWQRQCDAGVLPVRGVLGGVSFQTRPCDLFSTTPPCPNDHFHGHTGDFRSQDIPLTDPCAARRTIQNP